MPAKHKPVQRSTTLANASAEVTLSPQCRASVIKALGPEAGEAFLKAIAPGIPSIRRGWLVQKSQPSMDRLRKKLDRAAGHATRLHRALENLDDDAMAAVNQALLQRVSDAQPEPADTELESSDANAEAHLAWTRVADMWAADIDELEQLAAIAEPRTCPVGWMVCSC